MFHIQSSSGAAAAREGCSTLPGIAQCRRKFLRFFPGGFADDTYLAWERNYKWEAHRRWTTLLGKAEFERLLGCRDYAEIAKRTLQIESRTNLLFSFEKMAIRDAMRGTAGARAFSTGLYEFIHGGGAMSAKFDRFCEVVAALPRKQTRVLTWPVVTVFGFLAAPARYIFLKPMVTRRAAEACGFPFQYRSRPNWETYANYLEFARLVRRDLTALHPRDMIDIQSFLWVQGSDEYD